MEIHPPDDSELVRRARSGDVNAYEELVERHTNLAFRAAYLVTGSAADAEEAVQDAFVKAYRALPRFREGAPFRPFLLSIATNEARNRRRSSGRRDRLGQRLADEERAGSAASPEDTAVVNEERAALLAAIGRLREDDRLVIAYRYLLELSVEETVTALGIPAGTVKSRLSRALDRLRVELGAGSG